jgi:hypothetical protein
MAIRTFRKRGVPKAISRNLSWRDDGILEMRPFGVRGTWLGPDIYYHAIAHGMEEIAGISRMKAA